MKILGSVLILVASVTISYYYERQQKEQIVNLKSICRFLEHVKYRIELFAMPIKRIYEEYKDKDECIEGLMNGDSIELFSNELMGELNACFSTLGSCYKDEQISKLEFTISLINGEITALEKEYSQKIKVFRAIALFIGCSAVILLV